MSHSQDAGLRTQDSDRPLLLSTWSFGRRGNDAAWPALRDGGSALDAVETVARVIEADPDVDSVGYGGLLNRDGGITLDGMVMLAPDRMGCVCACRRCLHVVSLARRVMERTPHFMLAGDGADVFAEAQGLRHDDLVSPAAREAWERWRRDPKTIDQSRDRAQAPMRPIDCGGAGRLFVADRHDDTIGALALDAGGALAGACSTSGTPYKIPGRVGDSPVAGHGLYVHPEHGAAVGTGTGELISGVCGSFLAVELMRGGAAPVDALADVLRRIAESFTLRPEHQAAFIALTPDGQWASAALHGGFRTAVVDRAGGSRVVEPDFVLVPDTPG